MRCSRQRGEVAVQMQTRKSSRAAGNQQVQVFVADGGGRGYGLWDFIIADLCQCRSAVDGENVAQSTLKSFIESKSCEGSVQYVVLSLGSA